MTESPREFLLALPNESIGALADFLKASSTTGGTIRLEPDRPPTALEMQLVLAAAADRSGPAAVRLAPASPQMEAGLRLLGLNGLIEVVA